MWENLLFCVYYDLGIPDKIVIILGRLVLLVWWWLHVCIWKLPSLIYCESTISRGYHRVLLYTDEQICVSLIFSYVTVESKTLCTLWYYCLCWDSDRVVRNCVSFLFGDEHDFCLKADCMLCMLKSEGFCVHYAHCLS